MGNVVSQIISKILANQIKPILPNIISDSQNAFVPGRIITDDTTMAFEVIHCMRNRRNGKKGHIAVKLDISKALGGVGVPPKEMLKIGLRIMGQSSHGNCAYCILFNSNQWRS